MCQIHPIIQSPAYCWEGCSQQCGAIGNCIEGHVTKADINSFFPRGLAIRAYVCEIERLYNRRLIAGRDGISNMVL